MTQLAVQLDRVEGDRRATSSRKANGIALFVEYNDVCELEKMRSIKPYMKNMIARPTIGFAFGLRQKNSPMRAASLSHRRVLSNEIMADTMSKLLGKEQAV